MAALLFAPELATSFARNFVCARAAVVFGRNLARPYPPCILHAVERWIEGPFLHAQRIREALNVRGGVSMQWAATRKNREYE
jgi:hypothetical protein